VREVLRTIGNPLPAEVETKLDRLAQRTDVRSVTAAIQDLLDPRCLAVVEIQRDGSLRVLQGPSAADLVEGGWRSFLIKVVNRPERPARLRVRSPNAGPVPHARKEEIATRWLGLDLHEGLPLHPRLGGLELEYRVLQVLSRDPGEKPALVEFSASTKGSPDTGTIRQWRFDTGTDGWRAGNEVRLSSSRGTLQIEATGADPCLTTPVVARRGAMMLRFWAKAEEPGTGQVFWWTRNRSQPDARYVVNFDLEAGRERLYEIYFYAEDDLAGLRIDPNTVPCRMRIDWIELASSDSFGRTWAGVPIHFRTVPSTPIVFRVRDGDDPEPIAGFEIRDDRGQVFPAQAKRLAPDFFFQPQVYRGDGESVRVPPGRYMVHCRRGPESVPETRTLVVGREPVTLDYHVRRWVDAARLGWWSGDPHVHAAGCRHYEDPTQGVTPDDMFRHTRGEDLKVGCSLNWGPCFDYQKQFFTGRETDRARPPYLLRQDIEVSGFGSHRSGHLCLLGLEQQSPEGVTSIDDWPTLGLNVLRWAKRQGAVCGTAHSALGLTNTVGRLPGSEGKDGPDGLPNFLVPAFDGIGAHEFIVQVTHQVPGKDGGHVPAIDFLATMNSDRRAEWNLWYHVLNCGFRTRTSGETDFPCVSGDRVGIGRVYVQSDGAPSFPAWVEGLHAGRSYVSDGTVHLMDFRAVSAVLGVDGSELRLDRPDEIDISIKVAALRPEGGELPVDLVVNGLPLARQTVAADGSTRELTFRTRLERSSWIALRSYPSAHTNPIFVVLDGQPIRASRLSAEWCLRGVEECWKQKRFTYRTKEQEEARAAYDHARATYRRIREECRDGS
jgi:hypothetical protein